MVDAEDYDLWRRIGERFALANLAQVVLQYRIHAAQVSVSRRQSQAIGVAAARAAALARRNTGAAPLDTTEPITLQCCMPRDQQGGL